MTVQSRRETHSAPQCSTCASMYDPAGNSAFVHAFIFAKPHFCTLLLCVCVGANSVKPKSGCVKEMQRAFTSKGLVFKEQGVSKADSTEGSRV